MNWLIKISGPFLSIFIMWQTLIDTQVSKLVLLLRMILHGTEIALGIALGRPHLKATDYLWEEIVSKRARNAKWAIALTVKLI
jgi:hypothetical protein